MFGKVSFNFLLLITILVFATIPNAFPFVATTPPRYAQASLGKCCFFAAKDEDGNSGDDNNSSSNDGTKTSIVTSECEIVVTSIESTPNPSSFLIQLENPLPGLEFLAGSLRGETYYSKFGNRRRSSSSTPPPNTIASILEIDNIDFVFAMPTVLTINKKSRGTWETLLPSVLESLLNELPSEQKQEQLARLLTDFLLLGSSENSQNDAPPAATAGQVTMRIQTANGIPIQIEGTGSLLGTVKRKKLPQPKFQEAMEELQRRNPSIDFFRNRMWTDRGVRYVSQEDDDDDDEEHKPKNEEDALLASLLAPSEEEKEQRDIDAILLMEAEEIDAAYSVERLQRIVAENCPNETSDETTTTTEKQQSIEAETTDATKLPPESIDLEAVDRYCDAAEDGDTTALKILVHFVQSRKGLLAARRNALAYLGGTAGSEHFGATEHDAVIEAVANALQHERSAMMRRTAGDALSDLGDERAVPYAIVALQSDRSKLVQWRAARILGELATSEQASLVLEELAASSDQSSSKKYAFEVAFEIQDALRKVRGRLQNSGKSSTSANSVSQTGPMWKRIQEGTLATRADSTAASDLPNRNGDDS